MDKHIKIYKTSNGILADSGGRFFLIREEWDGFVNDDRLAEKLQALETQTAILPEKEAERLLENALMAPIGNQEIRASGVTYYRSREARMDESRDAGGGDFYDRVYEAERPELFFKALPHRTAGPGQFVRIRRDSRWNVPEPELTLFITSSGKIVGYTCGNDMSSRDIEGENPLYLPQAKSYDGSAAIGPCILVSQTPLPEDSLIRLEILREGNMIVSESIEISRIRRKFSELVSFLFRECSFPHGCFLMTGTGIVPPNEFSLRQHDEIRITIDRIGTLINNVE